MRAETNLFGYAECSRPSRCKGRANESRDKSYLAMPSVADLRVAKVQRFFDMAMSFGENISYGKNLNPYHFTQNTHVCFTQNTYVLFHAEYAEYAEKGNP